MKIGHPADKPAPATAAGTPAPASETAQARPWRRRARRRRAACRCQRDGRAVEHRLDPAARAAPRPSSTPTRSPASASDRDRHLQGQSRGDRRQADRQRAGAARQGAGLMPAARGARPAHSPDLEARLGGSRDPVWLALGNALRARDPVGIDLHAVELHRALASAVSHFSDAAKSGPVAAGLAQPPRDRERPGGRATRVAGTRHRRARPRDRRAAAARGLPLYSAVGAADRGMFKSGVIRA